MGKSIRKLHNFLYFRKSNESIKLLTFAKVLHVERKSIIPKHIKSLGDESSKLDETSSFLHRDTDQLLVAVIKLSSHGCMHKAPIKQLYNDHRKRTRNL